MLPPAAQWRDAWLAYLGGFGTLAVGALDRAAGHVVGDAGCDEHARHRGHVAGLREWTVMRAGHPVRVIITGVLFVLLAVTVIVTLADENGSWPTVWLAAAALCVGALVVHDIYG
jgi:hypothetical protein